MRIVLHREIPEDPELHRQWNAVALQTEQPQVFYTCEWALALQAAYRAVLKPLIVLGYESNELIGVASLATDPTEKRVSFLAANTADYCDFLSAPHRRGEFVNAVLAELRKAKLFSTALANLPADSQTSDALRHHAGKHGFYIYSRPAYLCSQVELGVGLQREELKIALAGKKKLRRYLREMERYGPVTFAHLCSWEEIQPALPAFADAHIARFLATGRASSLATPERRLFLEELSRRFDGTRVVTLSVMKIHERPVAWNYGFQFHGSWFWYQPTFDTSHEENSPGYCLLSKIVIDACDIDAMERVDLGLGGEGYKQRFENNTRQTLYISMTKSLSRHLREIARHRTAAALKKSPKMESAVRRLLSRFQP